MIGLWQSVPVLLVRTNVADVASRLPVHPRNNELLDTLLQRLDKITFCTASGINFFYPLVFFLIRFYVRHQAT